MPWKQLAPPNRAYFASKTAPTLNQYKAPAQPYQEALPGGGIYLHIQDLDVQPYTEGTALSKPLRHCRAALPVTLNAVAY